MDSGIGIIGFGAYIPRLRLARRAVAAANLWANPGLKSQGRGVRAMASWDEDAVTMAVEAGRGALGGAERGAIAGLVLGSTTAPFADRLNAGIAAAALGLPESVVALDLGGSMRAGTSALICGAALAAGAAGPVLIAAAERPQARPGSLQEFSHGDGAGAILLGRDNIIARIIATETLTRDFVDHFRATGEKHDYGWEERWVREEGYLKIVPAAVHAVLRKAQLKASDISHFLLPSPLQRIDAAVAKVLGIAETAIADNLRETCGFAGAAHALVMLAGVLERARPGERILLAGFGNGCDAIILEATEAIERYSSTAGLSAALAGGEATEDYMRLLSNNGEVGIEWGARAEFGNKYALTAEYRGGRDILGFIGGRDKATGDVQFPKTPMAVGPAARGIATYEDVPLADLSARVIACTADWLTYHPSPPFYFGLVQFENGARVAMEFVDVPGGTMEVGADVEMRFRVKEIDRMRNYRHYFWKATPCRTGAVAAVS